MDNIILGLLLMSDRTIYQLRERINQGLNLMYSSSMGSIQAALKKLLQCGYIAFTEIVENGKYKKVYSITDSGRQCFFAWVNAPMENMNVKNPELVKVYFMGFSDKAVRAENLKKHIELLKIRYEALEAICRAGETAQVPEEGREIFRYQLATAQYGRDFLKFHMEWYEKLLSQIEEESL